MWAIASVKSKTAGGKSTPREQFAGGPSEISIEKKGPMGPGVQLKLSDGYSLGTGVRGGPVKSFEKTAEIYLDLEAIIQCITEALNEKVFLPEDFFKNDLRSLLEAAIRIEALRAE
jgi:hypothetical protein